MSSSPTSAGVVDVTMPQMGVSVAEGTVVEWKKAVGDAVGRDEIICAISTDKIDTDVESPAAGTLSEILVDVGTTVEVGVVLARIDTGGGGSGGGGGGDDEVASPPNTEALSEAEVALNAPGEAGELSGDTEEVHEGTAVELPKFDRGNGARRYSPVVMRIAAEHGVDLAQVEGTGRGGRVRKQDVLAFLEHGGAGAGGAEEPPMHIESPYRPDEPSAPKARKPRFARIDEGPAQQAAGAASSTPPPVPSDLGPVQSGPLSRMRQSIGKAMVNSLQTAATCTTIVEVDMHRIEKLRKSGPVKLTALPFVARAVIETLREYPLLNATLEGDTHTVYEHVHLGVAVSLGEGGLIVPVIHNAHELSVEGLSSRVKDYAGRARTNQLSPDEVRGGTFTITNPGGYGSIIATPVIPLPQVAILDTEATVKRPVVVTDADGNDSIAIRPMTYFRMSWDHRALDGAYAAQFLSSLKGRIESWNGA